MFTDKRDSYFNKIYDDLNLMAKVVFRQMKSIRLLFENGTSDSDKDEFNNNEVILDSLEVRMKMEIINAIVLYGPRTNDLRKIMACYDVTSSLERIGDLLLNLYEYAEKINTEGEIYSALSDKVKEFMAVAENMTRNAFLAFTCEDLKLAVETISLDDMSDRLYKELFEQSAAVAVGKTLTQTQSMDVVSISSMAYNFERIGDNATNIAESAVYLMEGKNIQHLKG